MVSGHQSDGTDELPPLGRAQLPHQADVWPAEAGQVAGADAVLEPPQDHLQAGIDASPAVTGPVLDQPQHRSLDVAGLELVQRWRGPLAVPLFFSAFLNPLTP